MIEDCTESLREFNHELPGLLFGGYRRKIIIERTGEQLLNPNEKSERLKHANELIKIIGSHGRRFFWNKENDRYARLELRRGMVYFIDDYTEKAVFTHKTAIASRWKGFSHGGTLRSLIEDMRDYVIHGTKIARWKIVIPQIDANGLEGNIWGYDPHEAQATRDKAYALPIIKNQIILDNDLGQA
jgi:hypothetical protein